MNNKICALVGPDLMMGVSGFGDSVHEALAELAANLVKEAVWITAPREEVRATVTS
jgi:hypothetical protein